MNCSCGDKESVQFSDGKTCYVHKTHQVVDTFPEADVFRNAFVTVRSENAVYHVDDVGNLIAVSRSPLYIDGFDPDDIGTAPAYKSITIYDFSNNLMYVYGPEGDYRTLELDDPGEES